MAVLAQAPAQVRLDARLREMHLGIFQGLTVKEILAQLADEFDAYRYARGSQEHWAGMGIGDRLRLYDLRAKAFVWSMIKSDIRCTKHGPNQIAAPPKLQFSIVAAVNILASCCTSPMRISAGETTGTSFLGARARIRSMCVPRPRWRTLPGDTSARWWSLCATEASWTTSTGRAGRPMRCHMYLA
jgi:hypothetical protein